MGVNRGRERRKLREYLLADCLRTLLIVGYIHSGELKRYMQQFGQTISCMILRDNGKSRGFGFVTFTDPNAAEYVSTLYHEIYGKPFGCNLILPNKDAKNYQADKKNRKVYIKTKDKHPLIKREVYKAFEAFGRIEDLTILKESKERSGFITFLTKTSVEEVMKSPVVPYLGGTISCEMCLSRKEMKKKTTPPGGSEALGSTILNESIVSESNYYSPSQYGQSKVGPARTIHAKNYYMEENSYYDYSMRESFGSKKVSSGSNQRRSSKHSPGLPPKKFKEENLLSPEAHDYEHGRWNAQNTRYQHQYDQPNESGSKPKYVIEINNVKHEKLVPITEMNLSDSSLGNGQNLSAKQMKASVSVEGGFSKSPKPSVNHESGQNFLNIPNQNQARSRQHSDDKMLNPPNARVPHLFKSGSIEQPMQLTEKEKKLFLTEDEKENNKRDSSRPISNQSKKEMLSSKLSKSSQEPKQKAEENYKYNRISGQNELKLRPATLQAVSLQSPRSDCRERNRAWKTGEGKSEDNAAECKSVQN